MSLQLKLTAKMDLKIIEWVFESLEMFAYQFMAFNCVAHQETFKWEK